jgi:hypothetical protein
MITLRRLFGRNRSGARRGSAFDSYYAGLLREGSGYPTADEARRDLRRREQLLFPLGLPR